MIVKSYETHKINPKHHKYVLFYGKNEGFKSEKILAIFKNLTQKKIQKYDEKEILNNKEMFLNDLFSKSLFEEEKFIIINRVTDKIFTTIDQIIEKNLDDINIILNADTLEKRSKLRQVFEKKKELICVPFYQDNQETLKKITQNFLREKNILISQSNINLIINRCNGDRGILKTEIEKIENFSKGGKKITEESILKLTNLIENYDISELIDNCLAKNRKKTMQILSENNFSSDDCIIIVRTFLSKSKRILYLSKEFEKNKNIEKTILSAKPPIFWKDKELVKDQIQKWKPHKIQKLIYDINNIEILIKKNLSNSLNFVTDLILEKAS